MSKKEIKLSLTLDAKTGKLVANVKSASDEVEDFGKKGNQAGRDASDGLDEADSSAKRTRKSTDALGGAVKRVGHYLVAAFAVQKVFSVISMADEFDTLEQRIKTATQTTGDYVAVQERLLSITKDNGTELANSVELFQSLSRTRKDLDATNQDILTLTNTVQQLGIIGGASTMNMKAGLMQFSQGMSAGTLRAEEMNSMFENIPEVANRIAKGMNMTTSELQKAVKEGNVLSKEVFDSLLKQSESIDAEFENMPLTLARASSTLGTSFDQFIDKLNTSTGLTVKLANAFESISIQMDLMSGNATRNTLIDQIQGQVKVVDQYKAAITAANTFGGTGPVGALKQEQIKLNALQDAYNKKLLTGTDLLSLQYQLGQKNNKILTMENKLKEDASDIFKHITTSKWAGNEEDLLRLKNERKAIEGNIALLQKKKEVGSRPAGSGKKDTTEVEKERLKQDQLGLALSEKIFQLTASEAQKRQHILSTLSAENVELQKRLFLIQDDDAKANNDLDKAIADEERLDEIYQQKAETFNSLNEQVNALTESTRDYGDTWARTGDQILDAMGSVLSVMDEVNAKEQDYASDKQAIDSLRAQSIKDLQKVNKGASIEQITSSKEYHKLNNKLVKQELKLDKERVKNSLKGSLSMLDASVGMYEEGSKAQENAHKASLVFHTIQLGMDIAEAISAATVATATQGKGDPYTAAARIAAMAVMMGGLLSQIGASFSGGGSAPDISKQRQESQGTGTVLGDASAKSASISNSIELLNSINADQYIELQQINKGVKALDKSLGLTALQIAKAGLGDFTNIDFGFEGEIRKQTDAGLAFDPTTTMRDLMKDQLLNARAYGDVQIRGSDDSSGKISPFFRNTTLYKELDDDIKAHLSQAFIGLGDSMLSVNDALGLNLSDQIKDYKLDLPDISLEGMTAEEQQEALNNVFSAFSDGMTTELFPELVSTYQKMGETATETIFRLAADKGVVSDMLSMTGQDFGNHKEGEKIPSLSYFRNMRERIEPDAIAISESLIELAGSLEVLQEASASYYDKFFSEEEKALRHQQKLTEALKAQHIALPKTRDAYRDLVESLDMNTESGQKQYVTLMKMAEAADQYYTTLEEAAPVVENAIDNLQQLVSSALSSVEQATRDKQAQIRDSYNSASKHITAMIKDENALQKQRESAHKETVKSIQQSVQSLGTLKTALSSLRDNIFDADSTSQHSYMQAQSQLFDALANAQNGDLPNADDLSSSFARLSRNNEDNYASYQDYQRDQMLTGNAVNALLGLTDNQLDEQATTLSLLENSIAQSSAEHEQTLRHFNDQLAHEKHYMETQISALDSQLTELQKQTEIALGTYQATLSLGMQISNLKNTLTQLEVQQLIEQDKTPNGSHADGLSHVPYNDYRANLHQGEAVIDARTMAGMRKYGLGSSNNNSGLLNAIRDLKAEITALKSDNKQIGLQLIKFNRKTAATLEQFNQEGMPEVRV